MEGHTQVLQDILQIVTHIKDNAVSRDEFFEFKDEMYSFKDEMYNFKKEMYTFKDEMYSFKDEMYNFKKEMYAFKEEMNLFQADMRFFQKETRKSIGEVAERLTVLTQQSIEDTSRNAKDIMQLGHRVKHLEGHRRNQ